MKTASDRPTDLAARSLKWTSLIEILSRSSTSIVFLVLAAVLAPADFGLLASATVVVTFTQIFIDNGIARALVQYDKGSIDEVASSTFWLNVCLGVFLYAAIFAAAPLVAAFFDESALTWIVRVLGVQVIVAATSSVQQALLQRSFAFKRLLIAKTAAILVPGVIAVSLGWLGYGIWALLANALGMACINAVMLWFTCPWKPRFHYRWIAVAPIVSFGSWTLGEALASWAIFWCDVIVAGYFLGVEELGVYRVASSVVVIVFSLTLNPLISLLYPFFSRLQHDANRLREVFIGLSRVVAAAALPAGLAIAFVAPSLMPHLLGDRWIGIGGIVSLLALREAVAWLSAVNPELYRAVGRPDINVRIILIALCVVIPVYAFAAQYDLRTLATAKFLLTMVTFAIHTIFTVRLLGASPRFAWRVTRSPLVACAAMAALAGAASLAASVLALNAVASALVATAFGLLLFLVVLSRVDPDLIAMFRRFWHRAVSQDAYPGREA